LTAELAQSLGLKDTKGAVVSRVLADGPAAKAGIAQNDVIVKFGGTAVEDYQHLQRLTADAEVGKPVTVDVVRRGDRRSVPVTVAESPETTPAR
jgi:serine protease Do